MWDDPSMHDVPRSKERAEDWKAEHADTDGLHFDLAGPGTSAYSLCPACIHERDHEPPNDDTKNCELCQAEAERQWERRFER